MKLKQFTLIAAMVCTAASAQANTISYNFTGMYNAAYGATGVFLPYVGTFSITDPQETSVAPPNAPNTETLNGWTNAGIWDGTSKFYTGAENLVLTFANGAQLTANALDIVVNNTTVQGTGSPYPLGLSVQLFTKSALTSGMTQSSICADGTTNATCDDSGNDPLYRKGDATDLAVQHMNGVYFAFYNAPLSTVAAGVPELASTFGPTRGGLGVYSVTALNEPVTTLTSFNTFTSSVPEPSTWMLTLLGLPVCLLRRRATAAVKA